jgi:endonuclease YncB( thermonuclease family)
MLARRLSRRSVVAAAAVLWLSTPAAAEPLLDIAFEAKVTEVIDGDTVVLDDGTEVRLVGTQAPKLPLGRPGYPTWPLAPEAKAKLEQLVLGRRVGLGFGGNEWDRHGRRLALLWRSDGLWIQGAMVEAGLARVYGFADNRALVPELLALESGARAARRGIWANSYYDVLSARELELSADALVDSFQLVEGRVEEAAVVHDRAYLNFGNDWHADFTAVLQPETLDLFLSEGIDPAALSGRLVRIRGWVELYNGPMIEVTYPEQIEVLE